MQLGHFKNTLLFIGVAIKKMLAIQFVFMEIVWLACFCQKKVLFMYNAPTYYV